MFQDRGMSFRQRNTWIARLILANRRERRQVMGWLLGVTMAVFVIGLWVIDDWLARRLVAFAVWWGGCAILTIFLMIFAIYDAAKTIQEVREEK